MAQPSDAAQADPGLKDVLPGVPIVESPFFYRLLDSPPFDAVTREIAVSLHENGYAVVDFEDPDFDARADRIIEALKPRFDWDYWRRDGWAHNDSLRLQDAWRDNDDVRAIAVNAPILKLLTLLYGRRPRPFQTLNFPVGTQQHFHTDSIHFSCMPERFMCGVWVALEDVDETCGPLEYYVGSHKLPIYVNEHVGINSTLVTEPKGHYPRLEALWRELVTTLKLERRTFHARKGQALIWAANLLHGGMRQTNPERTRWSQVTHYYFDDCAYYTPLYSDPAYGRIAFREDMVDIQTGEALVNHYVHKPVPRSFIAATRSQGDEDEAPLPADFDGEQYLAANPDVKAAGMNPASHYRRFGFRERRRLRP